MHQWNKRSVASLTVMTLLAAPTVVLAEDVDVYMDGNMQKYDVSATMQDKRVLVPLRSVAESLGATVKWEGETGKITVTKGERSIVLQLGSCNILVDDQPNELPVPLGVVNDRAMVGYELFHAFGASVNWDTIHNAVRLMSEERKNKILNLMLPSEVMTMDTALATDFTTFTVLQQTGEGLVRRDESGRLVPGVAESWRVSSDGLTYTFLLRDGAKWSDGSKLTAIDFEYAWKRVLNPRTNSQYAFELSSIENATKFNEGKAEAGDVGVFAVDDRTLQVRLEKPQAYFLQLLTEPIFFPQKRPFVEAAGDTYGMEASKALYNGPFKLVEWNFDRSLRLVKNESYWDTVNVALEQVDFLINLKPEAATALYNDGTIDRMPLDAGNYEALNGVPNFSVVSRDTVCYLDFNLSGPKVLQNPKVRRALAYAIDGQALADVVYHDGKFGANGFVPNGLTDSQGRDFREQGGDLMRRDLNVTKAKELLQEGLKELGLTEFPHLKLLNQDSSIAIQTSEFIRQRWKSELGIDVEVENVPYKLKLERTLSNQDYDISVSAWQGDYNDPLTFLDILSTGHSYNHNGYSSKAYDQLIDDAKRALLESEERTSKLHDAEKVLINDMPIAPLLFFRDAYITQPSVKGWHDYGHGSQYDLKYVHLEGRK